MLCNRSDPVDVAILGEFFYVHKKRELHQHQILFLDLFIVFFCGENKVITRMLFVLVNTYLLLRMRPYISYVF